MIDKIDTAALRALAEAAEDGGLWYDPEHIVHASECTAFSEADAQFIPACSPATILALLDELGRLTAENAAQAQQIAQYQANDARYRWLRQGDNDERAMSGDCRGLYLPRREFLDAVIDREMAKDANATWAPVSAEQAAAIDSALGIVRAAASGAAQGDDHGK